MSLSTKDPVNQPLIELEEKIGLQKLGLMNSSVWYEDPRRLVFTLARYKFVAKMLSGKQRVLEIGCGDGFCARVVRQEVEELTISDYDPIFINKFTEIASPSWPIKTKVHNILEGHLPTEYDAVYSLDVMEHISPEDEELYLGNICKSLTTSGVAIIGMPSLESQQYASEGSKEGHINCQSGNNFRKSLTRYFENVFIFSMNDEVVHTGYSKMAHYLLGLCCSPKGN
jgi:cyclopropane fatty-acyl-phospholipid synthase-like methyltransferase